MLVNGSLSLLVASTVTCRVCISCSPQLSRPRLLWSHMLRSSPGCGGGSLVPVLAPCPLLWLLVGSFLTCVAGILGPHSWKSRLCLLSLGPRGLWVVEPPALDLSSEGLPQGTTTMTPFLLPVHPCTSLSCALTPIHALALPFLVFPLLPPLPLLLHTMSPGPLQLNSKETELPVPPIIADRQPLSYSGSLGTY